jgi:hypothetical protein
LSPGALAAATCNLVVTPKQIVKKSILEGLEDFKKGRAIGPFKTAKAAIRALRRRPRA